MHQARDPRQWQGREVRAFLASLLFVLLGLAVIWLSSFVVKVEGEAVIISLLLIPLLVYAITSGRLTELKGPGGLEAKFAEAAGQPTVQVAQPVEPSQGMQIVQKEGVRGLRRQLAELDETRPIIMTMELGRPYYDRQPLLEYLTLLSQYRTFKFVVFVDKDGRFRGYMPAWAFKGMLALPDLADEFIQTINEGRVQDLYRYPGVVSETISTRSTNLDALREMNRQNVEALVVIDDDRRLKGIVERDQALSRMMLALLGG